MNRDDSEKFWLVSRTKLTEAPRISDACWAMVLRQGHGNGQGSPRIEVLPADEQPRGVPRPALPPYREALGAQSFDPVPSTPPGGGLLGQGPIAPSEPPVKPAGGKQFGKGNAYASAGGKARANRAKLLREIPEAAQVPEAFKKFKGLADGFRKQHVSELARDVGGGECGTGPALMVKFASEQAAAAEWLITRARQNENAEDFMKAMQLQNSSRQNLMAAHEMCAKQAQAKRKARDPHGEFEKEFA